MKGEIFRLSLPQKHGISRKIQLFLKIFAEKFWYYENTIYLCDVKIIINGQNKITTSWKN